MNPTEISTSLQQFTADNALLFDPALRDTHGDQFVAAFAGKIIGHDTDHVALIERLRGEGYPMGNVALMFIEREPRIIVL